MVTMGEQTGALAASLEQVADWGERDNRLYKDVKGALTYPSVVMVMAFVLTLVLFLTVVPGFVSMFEERKMELPFLTEVVVLFTKIVTNPGAWVAGLGLAVLAYLTLRRALRNKRSAAKLYELICFIPVLGDLLSCSSAARYTGVLGTLLDSGLDLLNSLRLAAKASGNPRMELDSQRIVEEIQGGVGLADGFAPRPDIYPHEIIEMVRVGEESSNLSEMLLRTSRFLDQEVGYKVESLGAILEPLALMIVSVLVGTILLAIILPLYGFLNQL
jgi:type IV pilus assembly protein PilC